MGEAGTFFYFFKELKTKVVKMNVFTEIKENSSPILVDLLTLLNIHAAQIYSFCWVISLEYIPWGRITGLRGHSHFLNLFLFFSFFILVPKIEPKGA